MTDRSAVAALDAATADLDIGLVICNHLRGFGQGRFLDGNLEQCHDQLEANVRAYVDLAHCFGRRLATGAAADSSSSRLSRHRGLAVRRDVRRIESVRARVRLGPRLRVAEYGCRRAHTRAELGEHGDLPTGRTRAVAVFPTMEVSDFVSEALGALGSRWVFIPGRRNALTADVLGRLLPRRTATSVMGRNLEKMLGT